MLVMRRESRRGEKSNKAAYKTLSHFQATNLEQPHTQIECVW